MKTVHINPPGNFNPRETSPGLLYQPNVLAMSATVENNNNTYSKFNPLIPHQIIVFISYNIFKLLFFFSD